MEHCFTTKRRSGILPFLWLSSGAWLGLIAPAPAGLIVTAAPAVEGHDPTAAPKATFLLSLSPAAPTDTVWHYTTAADTAREGQDYVPVRGTLTIPAGQTSATVSVPLIPDLWREDPETFSLIVWPEGSVPSPVLTEIPKPQFTPATPYTWTSSAVGISSGNWFSQNLVGSRENGVWTPERQVASLNQSNGIKAIGGYGIIWIENINNEGRSESHLGFAERQRPGLTPWELTEMMSRPEAVSVAASGDVVAVNYRSTVELMQLFHNQPPRTIASFPVLPSSAFPPSFDITRRIVGLTGRRLAVSLYSTNYSEIRIYESPDDTLRAWSPVATIPDADLPAALEGDTLVAQQPSGGIHAPPRIYGKDQGGLNQWALAATINLPNPATFSTYSPVAMRGGILLIGDPANSNFSPPNTTGSIMVFIRGATPADWSYSGSFSSPFATSSGAFGAALAQGGQDLITTSASGLTTGWGGSFPGATVTITDDDIPFVTATTSVGFEPDTASLSQLSGGFTLSHETDVPVVIQWTTTPGTAADGTDYVPAAGQATIPAGSLSAPVQITLLPDSIFESDESFGLQITSASGAAAGPPAPPFVIRDTDRAGVVHADPFTTFEAVPPAGAQIKIFPSGGPLTMSATGIVPAIGETGKTPADYELATPGLDWPGVTQSFTASTAGTRFLPQPVTDDNSVEGDRMAAVAFNLSPGTVASSFSPRLVDGQVGTFPYLVFAEPSTDGHWAVAKKMTNPPQLSLYRRSVTASSSWEVSGSIPASLTGGSAANLWVKLRAGRLACYDRTSGNGWIFRLEAAGNPPWQLEAELTNLPLGAYSPVIDFDGDTLASSSGNGSLLLISRGLGDWKTRQELPAQGNTRISGLIVHLNSGLLYYFLWSGNEPVTIGTATRSGSPGAPWQPGPSVPVNLSPAVGHTIQQVMAHGSVLAVGISNNGISQTQLFRRSDEGEWHPEQTIADFPRALGRGVLICAAGTYAETGPLSVPWERMGTTQEPLNGSNRAVMDYADGVAITTAGANSIGLYVMEAGVDFTIVDEDSFHISIASSPQFAEPVGKENLRYVTISADTVIPIDITVPFQTGQNGTATAGSDFRPVQGEVVIPAGSFSANFAIPILPDTLQETTETIPLILGQPSYGVISPNSVVKNAVITDFPLKAAAPDRPSYLPEPLAGSAVYTIPFRMVTPSSGPLVVKYSTVTRSATSADFTVVSNALITVPAGASIIPVPLTVLADNLVEGVESLDIEITFVGTLAVNPVISTTVFLDDFPSEGQVPDSFTTPQNTPLPPAAIRNVLANDAPSLATAREGRAAAYGTLTWQNDGTFHYTPAPNFIGTDRFAYLAASADAYILPGPVPWKWLHPLNGVDPGTALSGFHSSWMLPAFDDTSWQSGSGMLGYGALGSGTGLPPDTNIGQSASGSRYTAYLRANFTAPPAPPPGMPGITLSFSCDDAAIFYLNGTELGRYAEAPIGTFASAADAYRLLAPTSHDIWEETEIRTMMFPAAQLLPGLNTLAVSIHNSFNTSSDLGFQLHSLHTGTITKPAYVTVTVTDNNQPPTLSPDVYTIAGTDVPVSSYLIGGSVYQNDGLFSPAGLPYEPVLEAVTGGNPVAPVTFDAATGHFSLTPPGGFYGTINFTYQVRDKDGWSTPAPVTVNVLPSRAWDVWRASKIGGDWQSAPAGPTADNDGDGVANSLEFILGTEPLTSEFVPPVSLRWNGTSWEAILLLKSSALSEFFLDLETTSNPAEPNWETLLRVPPTGFFQYQKLAPGATLVVEGAGPFLRHTVTWPDSGSATGFMRLRASRIPNVLDP